MLSYFQFVNIVLFQRIFARQCHESSDYLIPGLIDIDKARRARGLRTQVRYVIAQGRSDSERAANPP